MPRRWRCIGRPVELHEGSERREKEGSGAAGPSDEVHAAMDISGDAGLTDSAISIKTWNLRAQSHGKKRSVSDILTFFCLGWKPTNLTI